MDKNDKLDNHHSIVGVSWFSDDIFDNCQTCGFAVGWREDGTWGHDTDCDDSTVDAWLQKTS